MRKYLLFDIDGVLLPANPDPSLPYMKRLVYLRELCQEWRREQGLPSINDSLITQDDFDKKETTDLGHVLTLLYPNHRPFESPPHESVLSDLPMIAQSMIDYPDHLPSEWPPLCLVMSDLPRIAQSMIARSMDYYFELLQHWEGPIEYKPNPGVQEFLEQCRKEGYKMSIASGNPHPQTRSKLQLSGLLPYFLDGHYPTVDYGMRYGEDAFFRHEIIDHAHGRYGGDIQMIYFGDRESDIGAIARTNNIAYPYEMPVRGIITPSFNPDRLRQGRVQELIQSGQVMILDGFDRPSLREAAINFIESTTSGIEAHCPMPTRR